MSAMKNKKTASRKIRKPASKIVGSPFTKAIVPFADRFRKNGYVLQRPKLSDPIDLVGKPKKDYAEQGIKILNSLHSWRPPNERYRLKRPIAWTVIGSAFAIAVVMLCNAFGSRYVGDLPPLHRLRPHFCQFLAAQSFLSFDTGQYAIIARCTQVSPLNVSV